MDFKFKDKLRMDLSSLLEDDFEEEKIKLGIDAFEELINIDDDSSVFDKDYGKFLNESELGKMKVDDSTERYIVGFFEKLAKVTNNVADRESYGEVQIETIKDLFETYIGQCADNKEAISDRFHDYVINSINYVGFSKDLADGMEEFNKLFIQLKWSSEDGLNQRTGDYNQSEKFIGEAGMGKTTEMRKRYFDVVKKVIEQNKKVLPIWITLSELGEEMSLENSIKEKMGEYAIYYDALVKQNIIMLFLDGYNEVLDEEVKKSLAGFIDKFHSNNPNSYIAITDRTNNSNPPCLKKSVNIYKCSGLDDNEMKEYIRIKTEDPLRQKIITFLDSKEANWFKKKGVIPSKLNSLIDLMDNDKVFNNETELDYEYLVFILNREAEEKKETRISDLNYLLTKMAKELTSAEDEWTYNQIKEKWKGWSGMDIHAVDSMLKLAIELPILEEGKTTNCYKFAHTYFNPYHDGLI